MKNLINKFLFVTILTQIAACTGIIQSNTEVQEIKSRISRLDTMTYAKSINVLLVSPYGAIDPENNIRAIQFGSGATSSTYQSGHGPFTGHWVADSYTHYISLDDLENNQNLAIFGKHLGEIECLIFSPDGNLLASGGHDGAIFIWNVFEQTKQAVLMDPDPRNPKPYYIKRLAFFDLGNKIMVIREKGDVIVMDAKTGKNLLQIYDYEELDYNALVGMAYNPIDNTYLVVGKDFISIRHPETGKQSRLLIHPDLDSVVDMEVDHINNRLILTRRKNNDSTIMVWDMESYRLIYSISEKQRKIFKTALSPDSRILATAGDDAVLNLWDLQKRKIVHRLGFERKDSNYYVFKLNFSSGGDKVFYVLRK